MRKVIGNLQLILIGEALFWLFLYRQAVFLHSLILLFIFKVAFPCLKLEILVEARGFCRVWNKYVLRHEMPMTETETLIKKEVETIDRDLAELLDGER